MEQLSYMNFAESNRVSPSIVDRGIALVDSLHTEYDMSARIGYVCIPRCLKIIRFFFFFFRYFSSIIVHLFCLIDFTNSVTILASVLFCLFFLFGRLHKFCSCTCSTLLFFLHTRALMYVTTTIIISKMTYTISFSIISSLSTRISVRGSCKTIFISGCDCVWPIWYPDTANIPALKIFANQLPTPIFNQFLFCLFALLVLLFR